MPDLIDIKHSDIKQDIIDKYSEILDDIDIDYVPNANDDEHLIAEASAYRFLLMLESFNYEHSQLFLQHAQGARLTKLAKNFFGVERARTKARAEIAISFKEAKDTDGTTEGTEDATEDTTTKDTDGTTEDTGSTTTKNTGTIIETEEYKENDKYIFLKKDFILYSSKDEKEGEIKGRLITGLTISKDITPSNGAPSIGIFELIGDSSEDIVAETDTDTVFVRDDKAKDKDKDKDNRSLKEKLEIEQRSKYTGGGEEESDERLRQRCYDSLHKSSTAGTASSYEYHTSTVDSKITQVKVTTVSEEEEKDYQVKIYFYTNKDIVDIERDAIVKNVKEHLNDKVVPTSIKIELEHVKEIKYNLDASIILPLGSNKALYRERIEEGAKKELTKLEEIGRSITFYQIKNILGIDNSIIDVKIDKINFLDDKKALLDESSTIKSIDCGDNQILSLNELKLTVLEEGESKTEKGEETSG